MSIKSVYGSLELNESASTANTICIHCYSYCNQWCRFRLRHTISMVHWKTFSQFTVSVSWFQISGQLGSKMSFQNARDLYFCAKCKIIHDYKTHPLEPQFLIQQSKKRFNIKGCEIRLNRIKSKWSENEIGTMTTPIDLKHNSEHSPEKVIWSAREPGPIVMKFALCKVETNFHPNVLNLNLE